MAGNLDFRLRLLAEVDRFNSGINSAKFAATALATALASVGVGLGMRELAEAADSYTNLSARINIATKSGGDFYSAMAGVHQVALMTNSSLQATGDLFTRLNTVGKDMGMTQQQALNLTKTVTQAIQIGGGSAQASEAAVTQFIQAMQGGVLRGEEFNSIMENGYGLAEALAKGLGVTTGELRKMAENGELSAERVITAVQKQAAEVQKTYDQFPTTIGNALQRISTSWDILIGKMNQSNGASATVAQWLVVLADNIAELDVILEDIGDGFVWIGDQLKKIDPATIEALKKAATSTYEVIKQMAETLGDSFEVTGELLNSILGQLLDFNSGIDSANDKTNGFTKLLQVLNVALGFLNDGFSAVSIGVNLFAGALYSVASAWAGLVAKFSWGDVEADAIANMQAMQNKAEEFYKKASDGAIDFQSKGVQAFNEIGKTQQQKNDEALTRNKEVYLELFKQNEALVQNSKELADERTAIDSKLNQARKDGNQAVIDDIIKKSNELEIREKEYGVNKSALDKEMIASVQAYAEAAIKANGGVMDGTMQADLMAQGYIVTMNEAGKVAVEAWSKAEQGATETANATDLARKAAANLGVDLDIALERVSDKFRSSQSQVDNFANGLESMGVTGEKAGKLTYAAWVKWLETAKSQVEIDTAVEKLKEFKEQGVFSAKQVEQGMQAVRQVVQKLPNDLDPVEQAFERLGIKTKEQLKLAAESALADFNTIQASGKATAESLKEAYERVIQAANASGDAQVKAMANTKASSMGLSVEIDKTGKSVVNAGHDIEDSMHRARSSVDGLGHSFKGVGQIAQDEAESAGDAWERAVERAQSSNADFKAQMKRQGESLSNGIYNYNSYSKADILAKLKQMNYSDAEAQTLGASIWSKGQSADRDAYMSGYGRSTFGGMSTLIQQEFRNAASKGLTTQHGTNAINDALRGLSGGSSAPPNISMPTVNITSASEPKTSRLELVSGGKVSNLSGSKSDVDAVEKMLKQFELLDKAT